MEQDKQLKEILLISAEKATGGFTDAVMKKVSGLSGTPVYYQPLVSAKMQRRFVFVFGTLVVAIMGLCLILVLTDHHVVSWIQNRELPDLNYNRIFLFILTFWIVFAVNRFFERKFLFRRSPSY